MVVTLNRKFLRITPNGWEYSIYPAKHSSDRRGMAVAIHVRNPAVDPPFKRSFQVEWSTGEWTALQAASNHDDRTGKATAALPKFDAEALKIAGDTPMPTGADKDALLAAVADELNRRQRGEPR